MNVIRFSEILSRDAILNNFANLTEKNKVNIFSLVFLRIAKNYINQ